MYIILSDTLNDLASKALLKQAKLAFIVISKKILFCRYPFTADQDIPEMDWEVYLRETANAIVGQQTPQRQVNALLKSYK